MAMRHFDPEMVASRELEVDLWREANLVEARASSRQGLALAASRRGFRVQTQGSPETIELLDCLGLELREEDRSVARALHDDMKIRCQRAGIPDEVRPVALRDITSWLTRAWVPIVLVDARLVGDEEVPHWVVVTAVEPDVTVLHDPLAPRGDSRVSRRAFEERIGFRRVSCAVVVERRE